MSSRASPGVDRVPELPTSGWKVERPPWPLVEVRCLWVGRTTTRCSGVLETAPDIGPIIGPLPTLACSMH